MENNQFQPNHELFSDLFDNTDSYEYIKVSLGCRSGLEREAEGEGDTVCVVTPKYKNGGFAGTGAHAGFIVNLDSTLLVRAGFDANEINLAQGANLGTYEDENGAICADCLFADASPDNPTEIEFPSEACWSCVQMIEESKQIVW